MNDSMRELFPGNRDCKVSRDQKNI